MIMNQARAKAINKDSETGERSESPDFEFVETMHVWQFTCFGVLLDDIQTRRYRGENTDGPIAHNTKTIWTDAN